MTMMPTTFMLHPLNPANPRNSSESCKSEELIRGFKDSYAILTKHGIRAKTIRLDNEISKDFKDHLTSINLPFQLVSPGDHRANPAERAIQTFKNHFLLSC